MIDTQAIRSKILDLAMRGQLTEQLPEDGNAEELYQQIQKEKQELIKEGKIKKQKPLPEITDEEIPFDIPKNWKWVYLGELFEHNTGKALKTSDQNGQLLEYITTSNLYWDHFELKKLKSMYFKESEIDKCTVKKGDLLICEGGDIGRSAIWTFDYEIRIQNHIHKLRKYSDLIYTDFYYYLLWLYKQTDRISGIGIGLQGFSSKRVHSLIVPFVPYYEAVRVVLKVKKAFSVLDTIDKLQAQYADNLTALKSKLIDAAIQGKLTEQLPEDGTAEELIDRIKIEKEALISSRKIPKEKALPKINSGDIPFDIPDNWNWVRVQDVATYITDYVANGSFATLKANTKTYKEKNYALFVRTMDLSADFKDDCSYIDKKSYDFLKKSRLFGGELILPNIGASIGKAFIMPNLGMPMSLAPNSIMLKFTEPIINSYFSFIIKSSYGYKLLNKTQGGSATAKFSKTDLRSLIVPIPPLSEIKRIVQKLDEILPLCEKLK